MASDSALAQSRSTAESRETIVQGMQGERQGKEQQKRKGEEK
jgi:hypothetical protein